MTATPHPASSRRVILILCSLLVVSLASVLPGCLEHTGYAERDSKPGGRSYDILNPSNHPRFWLEVDWMMGAEPDYTADDQHEPLDSIIDIVYDYSPRNDVETLKTNSRLALAHHKSKHSLADIREYEELHRDIEITMEVFSLYVLYINGSYKGGTLRTPRWELPSRPPP